MNNSNCMPCLRFQQ